MSVMRGLDMPDDSCTTDAASARALRPSAVTAPGTIGCTKSHEPEPRLRSRWPNGTRRGPRRSPMRSTNEGGDVAAGERGSGTNGRSNGKAHGKSNGHANGKSNG